MSDDGGIRVNMSAKEGRSVTNDPLPTGKYHMAITDIELDKIKPGGEGKPENVGKPMFKVELTVQDGDYADRLAWTNVMCFDGALYSIAQMLKAQGIDVVENPDGSATFQVEGFKPNFIPGPAWWQGKTFICRLKLGRERTVKNKATGESKTYDARAEVKGFMAVPKDWDPKLSPKKPTEGSTGTVKAKASMLP